LVVGTWTSALRFSLRELLLLCAIVGVALASYLNYSPLRYTGNSLDAAIHGDGYFCLTDERTAECLFTRRGSFTIDESGRLALCSEGVSWLVSPAICISGEPSYVAISPRGLVLTRKANSAQAFAIGQLQLATFHRPSRLREVSPGIFIDTVGSGQPLLNIPGSEGAGLVCQGALHRAYR